MHAPRNDPNEVLTADGAEKVNVTKKLTALAFLCDAPRDTPY